MRRRGFGDAGIGAAVARTGIAHIRIAVVGIAVVRRGLGLFLSGWLRALRAAFELLEAELVIFLLFAHLLLHLQDLEIELLDLAVHLAQLIFQTGYAGAVLLGHLRLLGFLLLAEDAERRQVKGEPAVRGLPAVRRGGDA